MRHNYKGFWGCDSCCDIEVHRRSDGKHVFIATEVPANRGTSITNYAEHLATAMRKQHGLKPEDVIWIEHYPEVKGSTEGELRSGPFCRWRRHLPHSSLDQDHGSSCG